LKRVQASNPVRFKLTKKQNKMNTSESSDLAEKEKRKGGEKVETEVPWRVYGAHTLSTWGDNMWWFAGGNYMLELKSDNLRL